MTLKAPLVPTMQVAWPRKTAPAPRLELTASADPIITGVSFGIPIALANSGFKLLKVCSGAQSGDNRCAVIPASSNAWVSQSKSWVFSSPLPAAML